MPLPSIGTDAIPDRAEARVCRALTVFERKARTMPTITLTLSGSHSPEQTRRIVNDVISITDSALEKPLLRTALILRHVAPEEWFIGGQSLAELGKNSFRLEVTIVDETDTKAQKAEYIREIFEYMSQHIENLHPLSNVYVIDCRAAAYGYGGLTQEYALHHPGDAAFLDGRR
jgi:4-oxalocrotonate tautomerase